MSRDKRKVTLTCFKWRCHSSDDVADITRLTSIASAPAARVGNASSEPTSGVTSLPQAQAIRSGSKRRRATTRSNRPARCLLTYARTTYSESPIPLRLTSAPRHTGS